MPKLPSDFVKPPVFDNPLRSTTGKLVVTDGSHELLIRFEAGDWAAIQAACAAEGLAPEVFVQRAAREWLAGDRGQVASAGPSADAGSSYGAGRPRILAQLEGMVRERLERFAWVRRIMALVPDRPARASV